MARKLLVICFIFFFSLSAFAKTTCFIIKENDNILSQMGDAKARHTPCSTFKVALSLMGYDSGVLIDETTPKLPYLDSYKSGRDVTRQPHNPKMWMQNSCVWYSQQIAKTLGAEKFQCYLTKLEYGNQDASGDIKKNKALPLCWINDSLKISADEQIDFLQKLANNAVPVSQSAIEHTKNLIFLEELPNGWRLYGKTGSGNVEKADGTFDKNLQAGWFVGWIEKGGRKIVFAHHIEDEQKEPTSAGLRAKEMVISSLAAFYKGCGCHEKKT